METLVSFHQEEEDVSAIQVKAVEHSLGARFNLCILGGHHTGDATQVERLEPPGLPPVVVPLPKRVAQRKGHADVFETTMTRKTLEQAKRVSHVHRID